MRRSGSTMVRSILFAFFFITTILKLWDVCLHRSSTQTESEDTTNDSSEATKRALKPYEEVLNNDRRTAFKKKYRSPQKKNHRSKKMINTLMNTLNKNRDFDFEVDAAEEENPKTFEKSQMKKINTIKEQYFISYPSKSDYDESIPRSFPSLSLSTSSYLDNNESQPSAIVLTRFPVNTDLATVSRIHYKTRMKAIPPAKSPPTRYPTFTELPTFSKNSEVGLSKATTTFVQSIEPAKSPTRYPTFTGLPTFSKNTKTKSPTRYPTFTGFPTFSKNTKTKSPTRYPTFTELPTFSKNPKVGLAMTTTTSVQSIEPAKSPTRYPTFTELPTFSKKPKVSLAMIGILLSIPPSQTPTKFSTNEPSITLSDAPSERPLAKASHFPTISTSQSPTAKVSHFPTITTSQSPTAKTSHFPTITTSQSPTAKVSHSPTITTSQSPTAKVSHSPTITTSQSPTAKASHSPTITTSQNPLIKESHSPTITTSQSPSGLSSSHPSTYLSQSPSQVFSNEPSITLSEIPSEEPSAKESHSPTVMTSQSPSASSLNPTTLSSSLPSSSGSSQPSITVSGSPSERPTSTESIVPSTVLSLSPSPRGGNPFERVGDAFWGDDERYNFFGLCVDLADNGKRLAIGGPYTERGSVVIYELSTTNGDGDNVWSIVGQELIGNGWASHFGYSVSFSYSGDAIAIGSPFERPHGAVFVYEFDAPSNLWVAVGSPIEGQGAFEGGDQFGKSVSLAGVNSDRLVAGAGAGLYVQHYRLINSGSEREWLKYGMNVPITECSVQSTSISGKGNFMAVGDGGHNAGKGQVKIYSLTDSTGIVQIGQTLLGTSNFGKYGLTVSLSEDGRRVAIATPFHTVYSYPLAGLVQVLEYDPIQQIWQQLGNDISGDGRFMRLGYSASLSPDGTTVVIGVLNDHKSPGYAKLMKFNPKTSTWRQVGRDVVEEEHMTDSFGWSVALSGDYGRVAVGAPETKGGPDNRVGLGFVGVYDAVLEEQTNDSKNIQS